MEDDSDEYSVPIAETIKKFNALRTYLRMVTPNHQAFDSLVQKIKECDENELVRITYEVVDDVYAAQPHFEDQTRLVSMLSNCLWDYIMFKDEIVFAGGSAFAAHYRY